MAYGKAKGSTCGKNLNNKEMTMYSRQKKDRLKQQVETISLTQESMAPTALTLESDLNSKIQEANQRREEDAETTKRELEKIEERVTRK